MIDNPMIMLGILTFIIGNLLFALYINIKIDRMYMLLFHISVNIDTLGKGIKYYEDLSEKA